jgi:hypothetical protein
MFARTIMSRHRRAAAGPRTNFRNGGGDMDLSLAKTLATLDEIRLRVARALDRHPLCRNVEFDIVRMPRTGNTNWTISLQSVAPDALWEASDIVADIQDAYELAAAA